MNRNRLQEILKGLLKCVGIAAGVVGLQILAAIAVLAVIGLLLGLLIQQIPYL